VANVILLVLESWVAMMPSMTWTGGSLAGSSSGPEKCNGNAKGCTGERRFEAGTDEDGGRIGSGELLEELLSEIISGGLDVMGACIR
jgi:hypothetical protein